MGRIVWLGAGTRPDEAALDPSALARIADTGVAAAVRYAYAHSPFYRQRFDSEGVRPSRVKNARDLERIAPTTKADLSREGERFWCVPRERVVDIVTTSGTTGVPVVHPMTEADIARLGYNEALSFTCAGITRDDTAILAVTMDKCFIAGLAYYEGLRRIGAATVRVGSGSPLMLLGMLERLGATAVVSVPSFLRRVADYADERGIDLARLTVRKLVCIGEPVRTADFRLNALGSRIATAWGARIYSTYAATEFAASFCECEAGCGGHLHPELLHVEVLDDDGRPVPDGEVGEVVITTFGVEALPLIRFRTGDCTFITRERCECGRWSPRLGPIAGRRNQMMKVKGTTIYPAGAQNVLDAMEQVVDYVMIATSSATLSDELEVVIAVKGDALEAASAVRESLQGALRVTPSVRVATPEEIAGIQQADSYRKKRVFVDRRAGQ